MMIMNTNLLDKYLIHYFDCALMVDNNLTVDYSTENYSIIHCCITTLFTDTLYKFYKDVSYNKVTKQFTISSNMEIILTDKVVFQCYYWINHNEIHFICKENDPNDIYFNQFWYYINTSFSGYFVINHFKNNIEWSIFTSSIDDLVKIMPDKLFNKLMSDYFINSC